MPIANVRAALSAGPKLHPFTAEQLSDSPLCLYLMDETSGTAMSDSGSVGNAGSYLGASPTLGARSIFGLTAPDFGTEYATYPDSAALSAYHAGASGVGTWEFLVRFDAFTGTDAVLSTLDNKQLKVTRNGNGSLVTRMYTAVGGVTIMSAASADDVILVDTDYHVVITYDRSSPRLEVWVNGVSVATDTTAASGEYTGEADVDLVAGAYNSGLAGAIDGAICSVAQYPTALTNTQIADHYAAL